MLRVSLFAEETDVYTSHEISVQRQTMLPVPLSLYLLVEAEPVLTSPILWWMTTLLLKEIRVSIYVWETPHQWWSSLMMMVIINFFQNKDFLREKLAFSAPQIESGNVVINEDGGSAVVTVRLLNEVEKDFVLDYNTGEVPDGADGR